MKKLGQSLKEITMKVVTGIFMIALTFAGDLVFNEGETTREFTQMINTAIEAAQNHEPEVINPDKEWANSLSKEEAKAELERLEEMYDQFELNGYEDITAEVEAIQSKISALRERITGIKHEFSYCF